MEIDVADKKNLEKHGILSKVIRIFSVPLLNNLPDFFIKKMLAKTTRDGKVVLEQGGSTHALETMYTRQERRLFSRGILQGFADLFWQHCLSQPKAIRNRLKIVKRTL